MGVVTGLQGCL